MPFCRKGYKKPEARTRKVLIQLYNIKKHGTSRAFFMWRYVFGLRQNEAVYSVRKFFCLPFLSRKVGKGGLERSSNILRQIKKTRHCRVFSSSLSVGASAPSPDTKDFSGKVLWNLKSFAKINWCI